MKFNGNFSTAGRGEEGGERVGNKEKIHNLSFGKVFCGPFHSPTSVQFDASNSISVSFKGDKLFRKPSSSYPGLYGMLAFGRESRNRTDTEKLAISTWEIYTLKKH
jgi:hypothetical protein